MTQVQKERVSSYPDFSKSDLSIAVVGHGAVGSSIFYEFNKLNRQRAVPWKSLSWLSTDTLSNEIKEHNGDLSNYYDAIIFAGVPGSKYYANTHPDEDEKIADRTIDLIESITGSYVIYISTIDACMIEDNAYSRNRRRIENAFTSIKSANKMLTVIELPALYGSTIKKNVLYDIKHPLGTVNDRSSFEFAHKQILTYGSRDFLFGNIKTKAHTPTAITWSYDANFNKLSTSQESANVEFDNHKIVGNFLKTFKIGPKTFADDDKTSEPVSWSWSAASRLGNVFLTNLDSKFIWYNLDSLALDITSKKMKSQEIYLLYNDVRIKLDDSDDIRDNKFNTLSTIPSVYNILQQYYGQVRMRALLPNYDVLDNRNRIKARKIVYPVELIQSKHYSDINLMLSQTPFTSVKDMIDVIQ